MQSYIKLLATKENTIDFGRNLARTLSLNPCLILLFGDVGAGKTTFTTGFLKELLSDSQSILSPTYSYMNHYQGLIPVYHFDLYRIEEESELFELGLMEYLSNQQTLRIVEWPEKAPFLEEMADIVIHLESYNSGRRAKISSSIDGLA